MAKYLKYVEAERRTTRINLHLPNFEYLMMKANQQDVHREEKRTRYKIIKKISIYLLGSQILRSLQIMQDVCNCHEGNSAMHKLPDSLFSWIDLQSEDFEKRRSQNLFYLDIMQKFITDDCLEQKKLYNDLEVLQHYVRKLTDAYILSKQDIVNEELENMYEYLTKFEDMKDDFNESKNKLNRLTEKFFMSTLRKPEVEIEPFRTQMVDYRVHSAVEQRLRMSICAVKTEEQDLAENQKIRLLQQQIDEYKRKISHEQMAHLHSLSVYYSLCDQYRYGLYTMHENYDRMFDLYDNKITKYLSNITFMKDQTKFYEDVIKSNHLRIAELQSEDERKAEAKAKAMRLEEEARRKQEESIKMKKKTQRYIPGMHRKNKKNHLKT